MNAKSNATWIRLLTLLLLLFMLAACDSGSEEPAAPNPSATEAMVEPTEEEMVEPAEEEMAEPTAEMMEEPTEEMMEEPTAEHMDEHTPEATAEATSEPTEAPMEEEAAPVTSDTAAASLHTTLNNLLSEHVLLAASATNAALGGRNDEFEAAAASLDSNSQDIAAAVGSVYGEEAGAAFLDLWRAHIGFFVNYTTGVATGDTAAQEQAVSDLTAYSRDFGDFLSSANPNLPSDVVADLVVEHVLSLKAVVDAQATGDHAAAYSAIREARSHMDMIAAPLSGAIAQQFADQFDGAADSPAAGLRVALNGLLAEHAYLAASATNAALSGRSDEFEAAAAALDANSVELSEAVGSVYGDEAGEAFLALWRSHIGLFVDYTTAVAGGDTAGQEAAVTALTAYAGEFGTFLSTANPNLPQEAVADLVTEHILTLKAVVDAQATGDPVEAYTAVRHAYAHMQMVADPLAEAIVQQFPESFAETEVGQLPQPATLRFTSSTKAVACPLNG
jgi:hypothetical protein